MTKTINEREIILGTLLDITRDGAYSHIALRNVLDKYQYLDKKQRAFITRVVEGTLEHMIEIDYIINQFSKVKVNKMKPVIRTIIRSAVYQLKYMDGVPNSAVCNEAVKLATKKGFGSLKGFVNGVLRNIERNLDNVEYPDEQDTKASLSIRYSMPEWIVELWLQSYDRTVVEHMMQDFLQEKPITIRINENQITKQDLIMKLQSEGIEVAEHPYLPYALWISKVNYLSGLASFQAGDFYVQDVSSMLVTEIAQPKEGDYVIDVCAAPGGKALHLAEKLGESGHVEARDLTDYKIRLIEENLERSRRSNMEAIKQDATIYEEGSREKADIVIADLPCSGLGVLGKKTDLKYRMSKEQMQELVQLQRSMLSVVKDYVKPGGVLVYSTCTIHKEENQENVTWFLKEAPFELESIEGNLCDTLSKDVKQGCLQLLPGIHKSDGFFIAKFRKKM